MFMVSASGSSVTLQIANGMDGEKFKTSAAPTSLDLGSAEWIVEAPSQCLGADLTACRTLPLANFGTAVFSAASATADGHGGTIADPSWAASGLALGGAFGQLAAVPSSLSQDGTSFFVQW
jgi:hypothetical protein